MNVTLPKTTHRNKNELKEEKDTNISKLRTKLSTFDVYMYWI